MLVVIVNIYLKILIFLSELCESFFFVPTSCYGLHFEIAFFPVLFEAVNKNLKSTCVCARTASLCVCS